MDDIAPPSKDFAICAIGHGSRDQDGYLEFISFMEKLISRDPLRVIEHGFLELRQPTIAEAMAKLIAKDIKNIVLLPIVLTAGAHTQFDIPGEAGKVSEKYPELNIQYEPPAGLHSKIKEVCVDRIESAENKSHRKFSRHETLLLIVGSGSKYAEANSSALTLSSILKEEMKFGQTATCFANHTDPLFKETLHWALSTEFRRILILPYFLFTGVLLKGVLSVAEELQEENSDKEILWASHLSHHDAIVDMFWQRADSVKFDWI